MGKMLTIEQELPLTKGLKNKYQKVNSFHFSQSENCERKATNSTMTEVH